jgi:hypothetical protein
MNIKDKRKFHKITDIKGEYRQVKASDTYATNIEGLTILLSYLTSCGYKLYSEIYTFNGDHFYFSDKLNFISTAEERISKGANERSERKRILGYLYRSLDAMTEIAKRV